MYKPWGDSQYSNIDKAKGDTESLTKKIFFTHQCYILIYLLMFQLIYQYR